MLCKLNTLLEVNMLLELNTRPMDFNVHPARGIATKAEGDATKAPPL